MKNLLFTISLICILSNAYGQIGQYEYISLSRSGWPHISFAENGQATARIQGVDGNFAITSTNGGTNHFSVNTSTGNVGVGITPSSTARMYIHGFTRTTGKLSLISNSSALGDIISLYGDRIGNTAMYGFGIETNGGTLYNKAVSGYNWYVNKNADQGSSAVMKLNSSELVVDGKIRSEEVKVEIINGPDYVFEQGYELWTLQQTKAYISQNKHLPEIPSARKMESDGVNLGEMNMKLLKKIEELTLHLIEQNERMEKMEAELQSMKK